MKKNIFPFLLLIVAMSFGGCIKNTPYVTTPTPYLNVDIGTYIFNTTTVYPAVITGANNDTTVELYIYGDQLSTKEKIVLFIKNYKGQSGTFSIAAGQAAAWYEHYAGTTTIYSKRSVAQGGFISITKFTDDSMEGYFNFDTTDTLNMTNGTFTCPKPNYVAHHQ